MPIPTDAELEAFIAEHGPYRLACEVCDCDHYDGVKELPSDWGEIAECQSLKASLSTYDEEGDPEPPKGYSVLDWWTHMGICPDCAKAEDRR